ncbi:GATA transcription factor 29-like [Durio zibethinus]|uniref:GATA transcription factor 29-like n=1 Tax=Durio zibethinus TaxID=66656 RepID=A0A6P5ZLB6_DURZI|nr:GATA transcription factor 29-like [Durio zibethinus]
MDNFHWFNQAAGMNGSSNNKNVGNRVDLTLKLGLPDCDQNPALYQLEQYHVNPDSMAPNLCFSSPNTQGVFNQGAIVQGQQSFNGGQYAWPSDHMASNVHNMNYANAFNQFSGPSLGFPSYNFAPTHHHHQLLAPSFVSSSTYTLLDVPSRRRANQHQRELGSSSGSGSGKPGELRQHGGKYNDPNKRCTNYNCNTNDTPMWRKGPLGPKTLCNACGIKYRKEEEKRKAKEAGNRGQQSNPNG